jgi:hypothetical protein
VQVTVQLAVRHTANNGSADDVRSRSDTPLQGATVAVQVPQGYALTSAPRHLTLHTSAKCEVPPLVLHARRDVLPESLQCEATVLHTGMICNCFLLCYCYDSNCSVTAKLLRSILNKRLRVVSTRLLSQEAIVSKQYIRE